MIGTTFGYLEVYNITEPKLLQSITPSSSDQQHVSNLYCGSTLYLEPATNAFYYWFTGIDNSTIANVFDTNFTQYSSSYNTKLSGELPFHLSPNNYSPASICTLKTSNPTNGILAILYIIQCYDSYCLIFNGSSSIFTANITVPCIKYKTCYTLSVGCFINSYKDNTFAVVYFDDNEPSPNIRYSLYDLSGDPILPYNDTIFGDGNLDFGTNDMEQLFLTNNEYNNDFLLTWYASTSDFEGILAINGYKTLGLFPYTNINAVYTKIGSIEPKYFRAQLYTPIWEAICNCYIIPWGSIFDYIGNNFESTLTVTYVKTIQINQTSTYNITIIKKISDYVIATYPETDLVPPLSLVNLQILNYYNNYKPPYYFGNLHPYYGRSENYMYTALNLTIYSINDEGNISKAYSSNLFRNYGDIPENGDLGIPMYCNYADIYSPNNIVIGIWSTKDFKSYECYGSQIIVVQGP